MVAGAWGIGTGLGVKRPGPRRAPAPCNLCGLLGGLRDALGLRALPALARFVGHLLTFVEGLEPRAVYGGVMHEEVLTLLVGRDEAVALILTEPLNRSLGHLWDPPFVFWGPAPTKSRPVSSGRRFHQKQNPPSTALKAYHR